MKSGNEQKSTAKIRDAGGTSTVSSLKTSLGEPLCSWFLQTPGDHIKPLPNRLACIYSAWLLGFGIRLEESGTLCCWGDPEVRASLGLGNKSFVQCHLMPQWEFPKRRSEQGFANECSFIILTLENLSKPKRALRSFANVLEMWITKWFFSPFLLKYKIFLLHYKVMFWD